MAKINADALAASALSRNRISDGVTLVAAFGRQKPEPFTRLLSELKSRCSGSAVSRRWIRLYRDEQVHATIVGLEGERRGRSVVQKNIRERLGGASKAPPMDLEGLTEFLKSFVGTLDLAVPTRALGEGPKCRLTSPGGAT